MHTAKLGTQAACNQTTMSEGSNSDRAHNTSESTALSSAELEQIQALVSQDLEALLKEDADTDEINYAQILQRLNSTDALAKGVEEKLDNILENLDALLESLGTDSEERQSDGTPTPKSDSGDGTTTWRTDNKNDS
ncbi:hypothetical protein NMY22_g12765 [Coprinellus aureogranulatus]|nr:hypothetical protein NMY22_g12765 [Coprinellus aureogranulatus]